MARDLPFLPVRAVHKALNSVPRVDNVEVDQQSERSATEFQIRDDLSLMNRRDCVYRLDLHDDEILNHQIHSIPNFQLHTSIDHGKADLTFSLHARLVEFVVQAGLIGAFEQSSAQLRMNLHRSADDGMANFLRTPSMDRDRGHIAGIS